MKKNKILVALLSLAVFFASCDKEYNPTKPPVTPPVDTTTYKDNDNLLLGNPSNAAHILDSGDNYLLDHQYFILSYNKDKGIPNWVSWHLSQSDLGSTDRTDDFRYDNALPPGWYRPDYDAFFGSGFDRGHNCPSADRTTTVTANSTTFLMSNMIPQAPNNNQGVWANFEDYIRTRINTAGQEAYIIMGNYGIGGVGDNGPANYVDGGHVTVPAHIWKVVLFLQNGNDDLSRINTSTTVVSIDVPNTNSVSSSWQTYRTSVDAIEAATGLDLFSRVPVDIQAVIEAKSN
ncbi:DNA/RNA non-specific endonuclease [Ferruginibacter albus]|uniref:DNA/RNA non-specific endonuclease n=1 Tax=Ferruginibacter albus TaxID=2875540 RepID=UPI001CC73076|nr:DNA/RNA non-specific endonuclease [Ferruginibacter albus]UAY51321.1 DNA/RNA non-specific endonuclease [Ferruginibacter albus]